MIEIDNVGSKLKSATLLSPCYNQSVCNCSSPAPIRIKDILKGFWIGLYLTHQLSVAVNTDYQLVLYQDSDKIANIKSLQDIAPGLIFSTYLMQKTYFDFQVTSSSSISTASSNDAFQIDVKSK